MLIEDTKKLKEDVSVGYKKIAASSVTGKVSASMVLATLLSLTACGGGGSGTPATGGVSTACTDIAGEPDIMGQITFTPPTAIAGQTVMMNVPVDAETAYVGVALSGFDSAGIPVGSSTNSLTNISDYLTVPSPGVQTVNVPVTVSSASSAGSYYVTISICSVDVNACLRTTGAGGVAVSYGSNPVITTAKLWRFKYFANGSEISPSVSNLGAGVCDAQPILTVTAP